jgi:predicted nucleic acid-binding protein
MKLLISDANIFIDMEAGGLVQAMFKLPETFAVPDILFMEELVEYHPELPGHGLQVMSLTEETVAESMRLRQQHRHPSQNDLFALALAKQESCPLLTGDKRLRDVAKEEGVELKGTLWLIERMVEEAIISVNGAADAYAGMRHEKRRLPWAEVTKQLKRLGHKGK